MILALAVPNVYGLVLLTFWRWYLGMAVKLVKLPLLLVLKIVSVANVVKRLALQIS
jgi:hypothetical protein